MAYRHPVSQTETGRRDRKKLRTREDLRRAAIRIALEHGYEALTVEAITEAADVSVRTFFNYFASKDDALLGADPHQASQLAEALVARPAQEPPLTALHAIFAQYTESFTEREALWQDRMELLRRNPQLWPRMLAAFGAFERSLAEAIAARTGSDAETDIYPDLVAAAVVGATRISLAHWRAGRDDTSLAELIDTAFGLLAAGLEPPSTTTPPRHRHAHRRGATA
jgi:AcrR family transcriptional regulator